MPFLPLYYTVDDVDVFAADWERYILHYPATSIQQLVFLGGCGPENYKLGIGWPGNC